jgi:hypothetical protein
MPESGLSAASGRSCSASGKLHSLELGPHTFGIGLHSQKNLPVVCFIPQRDTTTEWQTPQYCINSNDMCGLNSVGVRFQSCFWHSYLQFSSFPPMKTQERYFKEVHDRKFIDIKSSLRIRKKISYNHCITYSMIQSVFRLSSTVMITLEALFNIRSSLISTANLLGLLQLHQGPFCISFILPT